MDSSRPAKGGAIILFGIALMIFGALAADAAWVGLPAFVGLVVALVGLIVALNDSPAT